MIPQQLSIIFAGEIRMINANGKNNVKHKKQAVRPA
jgi:hypothetical protein